MPGAPHTRVVANGVFRTPDADVEIFAYSFSLVGADFLTAPESDNVFDAVVAYHQRAETRIANACLLREVAISSVGANMRQIGETLRIPVDSALQGGGGGPIQHPLQVSLRVSLGSGFRGRSQRGGFYLPGPALPIQASSMLVEPGAIAGVRDSTLALIAQLRAGAGGDAGRMVIASAVAGNVPVNEVRVGRALDTIRTRRNNLPEAYAEGLVPA